MRITLILAATSSIVSCASSGGPTLDELGVASSTGTYKFVGDKLPKIWSCDVRTDNGGQYSTSSIPVRVTKTPLGIKIKAADERKFEPSIELQARLDEWNNANSINRSDFKLPSPSDAVRLGRGWVVAIDAGEWGGGVWWLGDDSTSRPLSYENGTRLIEVDGDVIAATGLYHLIESPAEIIRIRNNDVEGVTIQERYIIPVGARDIAASDDMVVAVGSMGPMVISNGALIMDPKNKLGSNYDRRRHNPEAESVAINEEQVVFVGERGGFSVYRDLPNSFERLQYVLEDSCRGASDPFYRF